VAVALRLILANPKVKSILLNIFGGITRCDEVARGILTALGEVKPDVPIVVRLAGTNEAQGQAVLAEADLPSVGSLAEAIRKVVNLAEGAWAI
jgi:succinyl-CoA synthetase beta subunit